MFTAALCDKMLYLEQTIVLRSKESVCEREGESEWGRRGSERERENKKTE